MTSDSLSPRDLERRIESLEGDIIRRPEYLERQKSLDKELDDQDRWNQSHDERHQWVARTLAALGVGLVATIITLIIRIATQVGVSP